MYSDRVKKILDLTREFYRMAEARDDTTEIEYEIETLEAALTDEEDDCLTEHYVDLVEEVLDGRSVEQIEHDMQQANTIAPSCVLH